MEANEKQPRKTASPAGAAQALVPAALSMLLPGAGHLMIRRWGRAAIWLAGWVVLIGVTGSSHNAAVFVLMVVSAVDAYVFARGDAAAAIEAREGTGGEPRG